jgi:hypothetical protein
MRTGFTTRFSKKPEMRARQAGPAVRLLTLTLVLFLASPGVLADGIRIEYASGRMAADTYQVDARIRFDFDEEVMSALAHGVQLDIDVLLQVTRERKWLWNAVVARRVLSFTLQHHPLTDDYLVTESWSGQKYQFSTADAAFKHVGTISGHDLIGRDLLSGDGTFTGRIRARLNTESLPAPLQTVAYVSREWKVESAWYEWEIR